MFMRIKIIVLLLQKQQLNKEVYKNENNNFKILQ